MIPQVIFKDENYAVLSKPSGMIVNNADTSKEVHTLQDWVKEVFGLEEGNVSDFLKRSGIVHRLDKETSGAILIAFNEKSFSFLQNQFKERIVEKEYIALCHGKMVEEGHISAPIGRLPWNRMRFGVLPKGRESYTEFKVLKKYVLRDGKNKYDLSLVNAFPKTGRTHQIRVHFQYAGHPIFADPLYGGRKTYNIDKKYLDRHFLHASKIAFRSPTTGAMVNYDVPLAPELNDLLNSHETIVEVER